MNAQCVALGRILHGLPTFVCKTFLINVYVEACKQVTHWLAARPPMSGAGFISSPVRGLTAAANLSCPFSFLFLTLSLCAAVSPSLDPQGACCIIAAGDAEANGEGTDRDERTSDATSSSFRRCKKFTMLISKRNMKADRSMFRPTSGRNGKTRHANKPNCDKTMHGNKETMPTPRGKLHVCRFGP